MEFAMDLDTVFFVISFPFYHFNERNESTFPVDIIICVCVEKEKFLQFTISPFKWPI